MDLDGNEPPGSTQWQIDINKVFGVFPAATLDAYGHLHWFAPATRTQNPVHVVTSKVAQGKGRIILRRNGAIHTQARRPFVISRPFKAGVGRIIISKPGAPAVVIVYTATRDVTFIISRAVKQGSGRVIATRSTQIGVPAVGTRSPRVISRTVRTGPGRIVQRRNPLPGPAVAPPEITIVATTRVPQGRGRVIVTRGRPTWATTSPRVISTPVRQGRGEVILSRTPMAAVVVISGAPGRSPILISKGVRQGRGFVALSASRPLGNPAQPTNKPLVVTRQFIPTRGRVIQTRPPRLPYVPVPTASPEVITRKLAQGPGRAIVSRPVRTGSKGLRPMVVSRPVPQGKGYRNVSRTPGAIGNPAVPTRSPKVISQGPFRPRTNNPIVTRNPPVFVPPPPAVLGRQPIVRNGRANVTIRGYCRITEGYKADSVAPPPPYVNPPGDPWLRPVHRWYGKAGFHVKLLVGAANVVHTYHDFEQITMEDNWLLLGIEPPTWDDRSDG